MKKINENKGVNNRMDKSDRLQGILRKLPLVWVDIIGAQHYTNRSRSRINLAITNGSLSYSKISGRLLFKIDWLDQWLEGTK